MYCIIYRRRQTTRVKRIAIARSTHSSEIVVSTVDSKNALTLAWSKKVCPSGYCITVTHSCSRPLWLSPRPSRSSPIEDQVSLHGSRTTESASSPDDRSHSGLLGHALPAAVGARLTRRSVRCFGNVVGEAANVYDGDGRTTADRVVDEQFVGYWLIDYQSINQLKLCPGHVESRLQVDGVWAERFIDVWESCERQCWGSC